MKPNPILNGVIRARFISKNLRLKKKLKVIIIGTLGIDFSILVRDKILNIFFN